MRPGGGRGAAGRRRVGGGEGRPGRQRTSAPLPPPPPSCGAGRAQVNAPFVQPRPQQTHGRILRGAAGPGTATGDCAAADTPRSRRPAALRGTGPRVALRRRGGERGGRGRRGRGGEVEAAAAPRRSPPQSPAGAPRPTWARLPRQSRAAAGHRRPAPPPPRAAPLLTEPSWDRSLPPPPTRGGGSGLRREEEAARTAGRGGWAPGTRPRRARVAVLRPGSGTGPRPPRRRRRRDRTARDGTGRDGSPPVGVGSGSPRDPASPGQRGEAAGRRAGSPPAPAPAGVGRPGRTLTEEKRRATLSCSSTPTPPPRVSIRFSTEVSRIFEEQGKWFTRVPSAYPVLHGAAGTLKARRLSLNAFALSFSDGAKGEGCSHRPVPLPSPHPYYHSLFILPIFLFFRGASPETPYSGKPLIVFGWCFVGVMSARCGSPLVQRYNEPVFSVQNAVAYSQRWKLGFLQLDILHPYSQLTPREEVFALRMDITTTVFFHNSCDLDRAITD